MPFEDFLRCPECGEPFQFSGANPHYNRARHVESAHLGGGHWSFDRITAPWYYKKEHGWKESSENVGKSPREDVNRSAAFNAKHRAFFEAEAEDLIRRRDERVRQEHQNREHAAREERERRRSEQETHRYEASSSRSRDTRTLEQKLTDMATHPRTPPHEAEVARHILFHRFGRKV